MVAFTIIIAFIALFIFRQSIFDKRKIIEEDLKTSNFKTMRKIRKQQEKLSSTFEDEYEELFA